jgi:RNA polymerase sigma-70 factor (sigma-E family)
VRRVAGSADEFRRFVESTSPAFLRAAYALLGDRPAAEDATQVALLRTYRHWDRALEKPGGYTWQVVVNVCRDELRRRGRSPETGAPDEAEDPSRQALDSAVADRLDLRGALQRLPYSQREVVVLRYYLELSVSETAHVLGVPEGTVKSMTARALSRLKGNLSTRDLEVHDVER